jgi:hypothetical protein
MASHRASTRRITETFDELAGQVNVSDVNRAGDVVGTFTHPTRLRTEAFLVRNDQVNYLSEYFTVRWTRCYGRMPSQTPA